MNRIAVLGSTGSIGRQTLEVIDRLGSRFKVVALAAGQNDRLLAEQIRKFRPRVAALASAPAFERLKQELTSEECALYSGDEGILTMVSDPELDIVVAAQVGFSGFRPILAALQAGKRIALANKEALVIGGDLLRKQGYLEGDRIIPVDSEHSAIWQCLAAGRREDLERIYLTASGGPFFGKKREDLENVTPEEALRHPSWSMGPKITIDSATLFNKGLEVIEAIQLFGVKPDQVQVVVHRQSAVHSMVEYKDGSVIAQVGSPDMRVPIQYALTYPERVASPADRFNPFGQVLTFEHPDRSTFPLLDLCYHAARRRGNAPAVINAANEVAVDLFLKGRITFLQISELVKNAFQEEDYLPDPGVDELISSDRATRARTLELAKIFGRED